MSVWVSRLVLDGDGPEETPRPIAYQDSHVIPSADDPRGGYLDTAHLPGFITRDRANDHGYGEDRPWWPFLLLSVSDAALSANTSTVVLDVAAVDALIADLTEWRAGVDEDRT